MTMFISLTLSRTEGFKKWSDNHRPTITKKTPATPPQLPSPELRRETMRRRRNSRTALGSFLASAALSSQEPRRSALRTGRKQYHAIISVAETRVSGVPLPVRLPS